MPALSALVGAVTRPYRATLACVGALLKLDRRLERVEDFADRRADLWPDAIPGNQRDLLYLCVARRRHVANLCADLRAARRAVQPLRRALKCVESFTVHPSVLCSDARSAQQQQLSGRAHLLKLGRQRGRSRAQAAKT